VSPTIRRGTLYGVSAASCLASISWSVAVVLSWCVALILTARDAKYFMYRHLHQVGLLLQLVWHRLGVGNCKGRSDEESRRGESVEKHLDYATKDAGQDKASAVKRVVFMRTKLARV
jgi:hypothetical protein